MYLYNMKLVLTDEQSALLEDGTVLGGEWHNLPFWYKKVGDNTYEPYMLKDTPKWVRQQVYGPGVLIQDKVVHEITITHLHEQSERLGVDGMTFKLSFNEKLPLPTVLKIREDLPEIYTNSVENGIYNCCIYSNMPSTDYIENKDLSPDTTLQYYTYE